MAMAIFIFVSVLGAELKWWANISFKCAVHGSVICIKVSKVKGQTIKTTNIQIQSNKLLEERQQKPKKRKNNTNRNLCSCAKPIFDWKTEEWGTEMGWMSGQKEKNEKQKTNERNATKKRQVKPHRTEDCIVCVVCRHWIYFSRLYFTKITMSVCPLCNTYLCQKLFTPATKISSSC